MDRSYESPKISDLGSLEELTAVCDSPGAGDAAFPGDLSHTTFTASPACLSD